MSWKEALKLVVFLLFFAATVLVNLMCSSSSNPVDPACGSGHVTWDAKAQRCRDQSNNQIIPNSCCGQ
jgi:hypothetical protein